MTTTYINRVWRDSYYRKALISYMLKGYVVCDRRRAISTINNIVSNHREDATVVKHINKFLSNYPPIVNNSRVRDRACTIATMVKDGNALARVRRYLDYGCGDGSITKRVGNSLGVPPDNIMGLDIHDGCEGLRYIKLGEYIEPGSVDLVTALVSFHHINDVYAAIKNIAGMLSRGGSFIIREHDFNGTQIMKEFLHAIHIYISITYGGNGDVSGIEYMSSDAWNDIIVANGFELASVETYKGNNPQALYYAHYVKK